MKNYSILKKSIFNLTICFFIVVGCSGSKSNGNDRYRIKPLSLRLQAPKVLIIYDNSNHYGVKCLEQTVRACRYGEILYEVFDINQREKLPALNEYASIAVVTESLWKLDKQQCQNLIAFVKDGGGLFIAFRSWNENLSTLFGVTNSYEPQFIEKDQNVYFLKEFLPGGDGLVIQQDDVSNYSYQVDSTITLIARTDEYPIVWFHRFGKGRVIYWNTGLLARKINRGFITRSIAAVQPFTAVVIANIGIFDLDDYPNSSNNVKLEPIKSEFDMTMSEFYTLRWYPDMLNLAKRFGIKYTAVVVFNYNGRTHPPYQFFEWLNGTFKLGGKEIKSSLFAARNLTDETELGLHGYNHQPLTIGNWKTEQNMKMALNAARNRWGVDHLGKLPFSYIPPLNIYDSTGVNVLTQTFPSIKEVGALYLGKYEKGQFREFGPEPWNEKLYVIPRNTSGYIMTDFFKRCMISILISNGIWAHFVHPDDVYPLGERYEENQLKELNIKSLKWYGEPQKNGLYYQLIRWLEFSKENFPWLRYMKRKDAYLVMQMYDRAKITASSQSNIVNLEVNVVPCYFQFFLREKNKLEGVVNCEVIHEYDTEFGSHYIFKANDHVMMLEFKDPIQ